MNRHDIFWKTAVRIHDTYRDRIKGEEAYAYSEDAARELQDAGLLAPDTDHPTHLETWEDFENAPVFTIICPPGEAPLIKRKDGRWKAVGFDEPLNTVGFIEGGDGTPMIVLRWGKGEVTHR